VVYGVESVDSDDAAMELLEVEHFDLVLIARKSGIVKRDLTVACEKGIPTS